MPWYDSVALESKLGFWICGPNGGERLIKWTYLLAVPLALAPAAPTAVFAQQAPLAQTQTAAPAPVPSYTQEELQALLAPIALYPDDLLTQVLVASTYPLEVVMANRWV